MTDTSASLDSFLGFLITMEVVFGAVFIVFGNFNYRQKLVGPAALAAFICGVVSIGCGFLGGLTTLVVNGYSLPLMLAVGLVVATCLLYSNQFPAATEES